MNSLSYLEWVFAQVGVDINTWFPPIMLIGVDVFHEQLEDVCLEGAMRDANAKLSLFEGIANPHVLLE